MDSNRKKYTEANRQAWNEVTPYHQKANKERLYHLFAQPGYSCLDATITKKLREWGIAGKDVAQLGCNNGKELISLKNLGAARAVGFDISDSAIDEARSLARHAGVESELVRTDIYEIPKEYYNRFDLLYISIGVLPWMPNLIDFFQVAARILRAGGAIFIYEMHPFMQMVDEQRKEAPVQLQESYFRKEPWVDTDSLDYYSHTEYQASPKYNFPYTVSGLLMALISNGIRIEYMEELEDDISCCFTEIEKLKPGLPMSFILIGKKTE